jgi:hypothetical protein
MEITLRIPDDLARRLGTAGELQRRALEALALEEYKLGPLTKPELRRLLDLETGQALDGLLQAHEAYRRDRRTQPAEAARGEARRAKARQAAANIIARGKGVTLDGLRIKDLINEGRR